MKTRRKTLLLSMRRYAHKAGINSGAEDRAGKVTAHASLSAAAIMIGTSLRKGSVVKEVIQRIR